MPRVNVVLPAPKVPCRKTTPPEQSRLASRPPKATVGEGPLGGILSDPTRAFDLDTALKRVERDLLSQALAAQRYNQRATARQLGLSYDQLRGRLRKHGLLGAAAETGAD